LLLKGGTYYAECPNCGKVACGEVGIEEEFGYRNTDQEK
jgi:hypothetical protein